MPRYNGPYSYPSLTPTYGLGSYARTGPAILVGGPRSKIGSQMRIYNYFRTPDSRAAYVLYLRKLIGPSPYTNPFSYL
jgi:hypothetical protein